MEKEVNKWKLDLTEHVEFSGTTWNAANTGDNHKNYQMNFEHAKLGIQSEIGEIANCFKKVIGYHRVLDVVNLKEEIGDFMFYISRLVDIIGVNPIIHPFLSDEFDNLVQKYTDIVDRMNIFCSSLHFGKSNTTNHNSIRLLVQCVFEIAETNHFTLQECIELNIVKLKHRYKEGKFTQQAVENRDLDGERKILEGRSGEENS